MPCMQAGREHTPARGEQLGHRGVVRLLRRFLVLACHLAVVLQVLGDRTPFPGGDDEVCGKVQAAQQLPRPSRLVAGDDDADAGVAQGGQSRAHIVVEIAVVQVLTLPGVLTRSVFGRHIDPRSCKPQRFRVVQSSGNDGPDERGQRVLRNVEPVCPGRPVAVVRVIVSPTSNRVV